MSQLNLQEDDVEHLMTTPVVTCSPSSSIQSIVDLMAARRIRHIPVVDDNNILKGIVSQRDLLSRPWSYSETDASARMRQHTTVEQLMTTPVFTARPNSPIGEAARYMLQKKHDALPVIDDNGAVVGMLTITDFLRIIVRSTSGENTGSIQQHG